MSLEDIARAEAAAAAEAQARGEAYREAQKRLLAEVPVRFFALARGLRDGVARFNGAAATDRPIAYRESAAVTTREPDPNRDFNLEIRRDPSSFVLTLDAMSRPHGPDALLIQGRGVLGVPPKTERFLLRVEGLPRDGDIDWRVSCDFRTVEAPLDELPDRLVAVVATGELDRLYQSLSPPKRGK
jgi:hypothetical protein